MTISDKVKKYWKTFREECDLMQENEQLQAQADMLKRLEWFTVGVNATWDKPIKMCPICRELKEKGHKPDCELAALLKESEGRGMSCVSGNCIRCQDELHLLGWCSGSRNDCEKKLLETTETLRQEIDSLQKCYDMTNESWKKLKQENEQLRIDLASMGQMVADYNTALDDIERLQQNYNELDNGHHKLFMAYSEQRKALRKAREALELIYKKHTDIPNHNKYPKTCVVCGEALAAIDKIGGREDGETGTAI